MLGDRCESLSEAVPAQGVTVGATWKMEALFPWGVLHTKIHPVSESDKKGEAATPGAPVDPRDEVICACNHVTAGQILDLMAKGTRRLFLIQRETAAATGCGQCKPRLVEFLIQNRGDGAPPR
jgi:NAD(P)H-nitrite reductase large subunit